MQKKPKAEIFFQVLLYLVFGLYLFLLAAILFRSRLSARSVNLIPFRGIVSYLSGIDFVTHTDNGYLLQAFAVTNLVGNITIFIPLGVYVHLFSRKKQIWKSLLAVTLISTIAEVVQVVFKFGIGDVDDVILNSFGGLIGILLCLLLYRLCKEEILVRRVIAIFAPFAGIASLLGLVLYNSL